MRVMALILAGGAGTRLGVLSERRAKPAVPFAGRYRIIDFALSNCVNSGIFDVGVLTQYLPRSLNDHIGIGRPWDLDRSRGGVRLLQPFQGTGNQDWYGGTADAVLQNIEVLRDSRADTVLILSSDHIYKMDFRPMLRAHETRRADLTLAAMDVPLEQANRFGIVVTDESDRVIRFLEKPKDPPSTLANMGVYVFNAAVLIERLRSMAKEHPDLDFGKHIIPAMVEQRQGVYSYPFEGYWVDVGTVDAYWKTSMELVSGACALDLYDPNWVIHTRSEERPPMKIGPQGSVQQSMVCNGSIVRGQVIRSVLSPGVYLSPAAVVRESVIMNDTWIGPGAVVDRCILDKNVVVGGGTMLGWGDDNTPNEAAPDRFDTGITVVGKGAHIPANTQIGRNVVIETDVDIEAFAEFGNVVPSGKTVR
jgi:glucose-1-phosphate adenylyltransferase